MTKYDQLAQKITARMIDRIQAADLADNMAKLWDVGEFAHFSPSNATTGDYYRTGALGIFQIHECTRLAPSRELDRPHIK